MKNLPRHQEGNELISRPLELFPPQVGRFIRRFLDDDAAVSRSDSNHLSVSLPVCGVLNTSLKQEVVFSAAGRRESQHEDSKTQ